MTLQERKTKELIKEYRELDELINIISCYSVRDIQLQNEIQKELERRGITNIQ